MNDFIGLFSELPVLHTVVIDGWPTLSASAADAVFGHCHLLELIQARSEDVEFWRGHKSGRKITQLFEWDTWTREEVAMARSRLRTLE